MRNLQWLGPDLLIITRGIAGLLVLIIGGVMLAEGGINDLTHYAQHTEFFKLQITKMGIYTFCFLGEHMNVHSVIQIGNISSSGRIICLEIGGTNLVINTCPVLDLRIFLILLDTWIMAVKQGMLVLVADMGNWFLKGCFRIGDVCFALFSIIQTAYHTWF